MLSVSSRQPVHVLSSSQTNALAVAVFLSFNLGLSALPLQVMMLDDPLQSLDEVNLLGLIDLLRRTKEDRQLILSTHDRRFGALLERKLRPVDENQRTLMVELDGWSRGGVNVRYHEIEQDLSPLRVVA